MSRGHCTFLVKLHGGHAGDVVMWITGRLRRQRRARCYDVIVSYRGRSGLVLTALFFGVAIPPAHAQTPVAESLAPATGAAPRTLPVSSPPTGRGHPAGSSATSAHPWASRPPLSRRGYYAPHDYRPLRLDYVEGQPIPPGYVLGTKSYKWIAAVGGGIMVLGYVVSLYATPLVLLGLDAESEEFAYAFIPIANAFTPLSIEANRATVMLAVLGGGSQLAGLGVGIAGLAIPSKKQLLRVSGIGIEPFVLPGGVGLRGRF